MTGDSELTARIRRILADVPDVTEQRMFGSTGFMVRGKLCVSGRAERMMCRIDPAIHDAALERDGCQTVVMKGQERRGYVYVAAEALRADEALRYWLDLALEYNDALS
jgi:TfoX/Sxy family transcriptional regulator of competence genes